MLTVDLTPRLARQSETQAKDTFLFDKLLLGFGLRVHPSGRKVWIVQAHIDGRSRRIEPQPGTPTDEVQASFGRQATLRRNELPAGKLGIRPIAIVHKQGSPAVGA